MALESKRLLAGLSVAAFCLFLTTVCLWVFTDSLFMHKEAVNSGRQLIALGGLHGYLPGAMLGMFGMAAVIIYIVLSTFWESNVDNTMIRGQRAALLIIVFSVAGTFAGHHLMQFYWERQAAQAGYTQCSGTSLLLSRATWSAWVKDTELCYDQDARRIIITGSTKESEQLEARLNAKKRIEKAREK